MKGKKKLKLIVLDTETTNSLDDPFMYDLGYIVTDEKGEVFLSRSFVIEEIFLDKELMESAYFAEKRPQYWEDIEKGKRVLAPLKTIRLQLAEDCKKYEISIISAHNALFDYKAMQGTQRYLTCSKYRWFIPFGIEIWDSLKMARKAFGNDKNYITFCTENNYLTQYKKPKFTAEILYRYIINDISFTESHTGLEDVMIEKVIFSECYKRGIVNGKLWDE